MQLVLEGRTRKCSPVEGAGDLLEGSSLQTDLAPARGVFFLVLLLICLIKYLMHFDMKHNLLMRPYLLFGRVCENMSM